MRPHAAILSALAVQLLATSAFAAKNSAPLIGMALASGKPTLIDFGSRGCIPCEKMAPILAALEKEYRGKANVIFVDVKEEREIGSQYRVQMIPTQVFFDGKGREVKRHIGFFDRSDILKELKAAGLK